jgi:acylphosphatase
MTEMAEKNEMANMAHLSTIVYGHVQGVFFRYFAQDVAKRLGLKGYVRNLARGDTVEVQAEGKKQQLNKLLEQLKVGPPGARVERVEVKWADYSGEFDDFSVRY